jgi:hypothetical protein
LTLIVVIFALSFLYARRHERRTQREGVDDEAKHLFD